VPTMSRSYQKEWNARNPDKMREYSRRYNQTHPNRHKIRYRKTKYGPNAIVHYETKLVEQKGFCAICGELMVPPNQDHNHKTGKLRDLLCRGCNAGLGNFRENKEWLKKAIAYLERHECQS
jgi:hypothetical protein